MRLSALPARAFRPRLDRPGSSSAWSGHVSFVHDLIAALRPSILVELGTHYGESYFAMCQAIHENAVSCVSYAVDSWVGDKHAKRYDESVFEEVNRYNEENYASFSKLLRTSFDQALRNFADESIDLLHIDGLHTYEAVRHDFDNWIPKVRPGGVVLLHDTIARHLDFGVWKLWQEVSAEYPHLEFTHSWGLGVLQKPGGGTSPAEFLEMVFGASPAERDFLRHYYASQAAVLESADLVRRVSADAVQALFQVFPHLADGYTEASSVFTSVKVGEWQSLTLRLPRGSTHGRIRIDPADRPCVVEIAGLEVRGERDGSVLQGWGNEEIDGLSGINGLVRLAGAHLRFLCTGRDPHFVLPEIGGEAGDQPLVLKVRIRVDLDLSAAVAELQMDRRRTPAPAVPLEQAIGEREAALVRNQQLSAEIRNLQTERVAAVAEYRRVHALNESLLNERAALIDRVSAEHEALKKELDIVHQSRSWKLTAPLRRLRRAIR